MSAKSKGPGKGEQGANWLKAAVDANKAAQVEKAKTIAEAQARAPGGARPVGKRSSEEHVRRPGERPIRVLGARLLSGFSLPKMDFLPDFLTIA